MVRKQYLHHNFQFKQFNFQFTLSFELYILAKGKQIDANQEMIALGFCNLAGSFVQSFPTTGSFSRTAVNSASGVRTQAGGIYTGALVLLALAFLMPLCAYIPQASLGALIITAVIYSVEFDLLVPMWKSKRKCILNL